MEMHLSHSNRHSYLLTLQEYTLQICQLMKSRPNNAVLAVLAIRNAGAIVSLDDCTSPLKSADNLVHQVIERNTDRFLI